MQKFKTQNYGGIKMTQKTTNELHEKEIVRLVKGGCISTLDSFMESFEGTIAVSYKVHICHEDNMDYEDFQQECCRGVIRALKDFKQNTYGQLRNFVKSTINNTAKDIVAKHRNQKNYNILGKDSEDVYDLTARKQKYSLENEVVNRLTFEHSVEKFIRKNLTEKQFNVVKAFYLGECPREYELRNGMKPRSFDKALQRALKKLRKIIETEEFKAFHFLSVPPKYMIVN